MAVDSTYKKLSQYCAVGFESSYESTNYIKALRIRSHILNNLEDVNYTILPHSSLSQFTSSNFLGFTPLHFIVRFGGDAISVTKLIKQGANFTVKNGNGQTAIHQLMYALFACGDKAVVHSFLQGKPVFLPGLPTILSAHVDYSILENPCDQYGISHFLIACMINHVKAVEFFLKNGVPINEVIDERSKILPGYSPLHVAVRFCALETVQILLKLGADINLKNVEGKTAVHFLIERNIAVMNWIDMGNEKTRQKMKLEVKTNEEILNLLLAKDSNHECSGLSLLQIACTMQNHSKVKQLLKGVVDLDHQVNADSIVWPGYTALHFAAHSNINTVKLLLQNGANLFTKDANGVTPFDLCMERYDSANIHSLLRNQLNLNNIKFSDKKTKLCDFVFAMQDKNTFESFLQQIPDLNIYIPLDSVMWPGFTPLHLAVIFDGRNRNFKDFEDFLENTQYMTDDEDESENKEGNGDGSDDDDNGEDESENEEGNEVGNDDDDDNDDDDERENCTKNKKESNVERKNGTKIQDENGSESDEEHWDKNYASDTRANRNKKKNEKVFKSYLNLDRIKLCLQRGADVCKQNVSGSTPLHLAFRLQNKNTINCLMKFHKSGVNPIDSENLSHLHIAVAHAKKVTVKKLLEADKTCVNIPVKSNFSFFTNFAVDMNSAGEYVGSKRTIRVGSTPLHIAVLSGNHEMAKLLLDFGANVYARDVDGFTPIHRLIEAKSDDILVKFEEFLQSIENLEDRVVQSAGLSHLHIASLVSCMDVDFIEKLLDRGADIEAKIEATELLPFLKPYDKMTPLKLAASNSCDEAAGFLIERGAKVIPRDATVGSSALYEAFCFSSGDYEDTQAIFIEAVLEDDDLRQLIERETGITVLHLACYVLNDELAGEMLDEGANVDARTHEDSPLWPGCSPLHVVVTKISNPLGPAGAADAELVVKLLLKHGADVNSMDDKHETPIHLASRRCSDFHPHILNWLLNAIKDFNVDPVDFKGISHFHLACSRDCDQVVGKFLNHGVDLNRQVDYFEYRYEGGRSPLHMALVHGSEKSRDLLLAHGADVRLSDRLGDTPLHIVIKKYPSSFELLEKIISAGADVLAENVYGMTPLEMLLQSEDTSKEILDLIFRKDIHVNVFNSLTGEGYLAIAFHAISINEEEVKMKPAFEVMMTRPNLNVADGMGRNAIHNLVSSNLRKIDGFHRRYNTIKNYTLTIDRLSRIGCDVDQRDNRGRTPLHIATQVGNCEAIIALFNCGVDVNIVDEDGEPALAYVFKYGACSNIFRPYYCYLSLICSFGFELSKENCELYHKALCIFEWKPVIMGHDDKEIEKLKNWRIGSLKLFELLKDKGVVAYTMMSNKERLVVDELFQSGRLRDEVPNTICFLITRYRQARVDLKARLALMEPALISLRYLVPCELPDVCAYIILNFLMTSELTNLIIAGVHE